MTIKKQWLITLITVVIVTVFINTVLLTILINKNFNTYVSNIYKENVSKIISTIEESSKKDISNMQLEMNLKGHLDDPIVGIIIYDNYGREILSVGNTMMHHMMMMGSTREDVESYDVKDKSSDIGKVYIVKNASIDGSSTINIFKKTLVMNSLIVSAIVIFLAIIISLYMSKKTVDDLKKTEELAQNINLGNDTNIKLSSIKEIRFIQVSLQELSSKLKLKQKGRKKLIDEMIHQTRTPLTILKSHVEAYEDGILELNSSEFNILEEQIDNVTSIISNMSEMIEGEKDLEEIKIEKVNLNDLINQIGNGLKLQFKKKNIDFKIVENNNICINTDRYKLSQTIYNILTNSYKFTLEGGTVRLEIFKEDKNIKIIIEDTGIGIKKEDLKRIFEAYYRGVNTNKIKGEGIGLYVAYENIEAIKGKIEVESKCGIGTKFIIMLPYT